MRFSNGPDPTGTQVYPTRDHVDCGACCVGLPII